ncbi:MAG TPA: creatininase family protein [Bryobacteraceae bacterium]|nr:creatininase family protein [Bryobacteraceae bacterium]
MKPDRLLFAEMTREQLRAVAAETTVVLPLGATEQHGPHLPSGTDFFTVDRLARAAAERASSEIAITVAPALPFGSSDHHLIFGATLSLRTETYYCVLTDLLRSLVTDGFRRIFLLNGHGGNHELAELAARDIALELPARIAAASYWTIAWDALVAAQAHLGCRLPGHAGIFETSMMLALRPELVAAERPHRDRTGDTDPRNFHAPYRHERHGSWKEIDGYSDSPDGGSAERGHRYFEAIVGAVARAFVEFANATP